MKVEFYKHNVDREDIARVVEALKQPMLTTGATVQEFEEKLTEYLGCKYVVGVSSCTAALHLSLLGLELEGSIVHTTPLTFVATTNSILYVDSTPNLTDVERNTGNIDLSKIQPIAGDVIMPVFLYGEPCNLKSLYSLAGEYKIIDCAHALESARVLDWDKIDTACFSFYPIKSITSGEGGAVATNNKDLAERIRVLRLHGMTSGAHERYGKKYQHWDMEHLGWKYNMTNIQAAMLLGQLARVDELQERRKKIYRAYHRALKDCVELMDYSKDSSFLMFTILVDNRDEVLLKLQERGIGVAVNFRPVHLLKYYKDFFGYRRGSFPNAEYIGDRTITLPLYPKLTKEEAKYVIESVKESIK